MTTLVVRLFALFNPKLKLFINGRKNVFEILQKQLEPTDHVIWFHAASLGEFEQGLPVMEGVKSNFPNHKILVTFFSPSGYEIRKNHPLPDVITYLPLDSLKNARKFIQLTKPSIAVFIKYEFWPNFLHVLAKEQTPVIAIASIFRKNQIFFKSYGAFMRKAIKTVDHFFVQDSDSQLLLESIGIKDTSLSGDTRFDRVSEIVERDNSLDFIAQFKQDFLCIVAGSTWPEDEAALIEYINQSDANLKFIIAPHTIKPEKIQKLAAQISRQSVLYSQMNSSDVKNAQVYIVDTIGLLTKIYSYADIAYVGGGMGKTGLHNTLEPAVFGIPVLIGSNYQKFKEARDLVALGGILTINNSEELIKELKELVTNKKKRDATGKINHDYITQNKGAKVQILDYIRTLLETKTI
ncbi:3-deoxy-D-manno-octulosonic acid transferase [Ascidiimonas sp. W6]|uniref:3-deoxy-D-manno-octulosonic acid transferase n=1 Tax=Ascidiimonas meishanensis TaxID=3128903 RepID=UPI0030ED37F4